MALLCSPNLFSSQYQQLSFSRSESRVSLNQRKCSCSASSPSSSSRPSPEMGVSRRDLMLFGLCSSLSAALPFSDCLAEDDLKMASMVDEINAYSYSYPMELQSKKFSFKWAESRKPERYSSAAPLSPDARLRIVSERVDFVDNLIISVTIGPPNVQFIKSKDKSVWNAKDVADSVLSDKSTLRVTSSQRLAESSLLDAHTTQVDGQPYWFYEYLVRKSPTKDNYQVQEYRHYVASTAERDGYLYSLSASTLNRQWGKVPS
ncbi:PsbP domain-containing protein 5, chloroplastic [Linum perenne]